MVPWTQSLPVWHNVCMLSRLRTKSFLVGATIIGLLLSAYLYASELAGRVMHPALASNSGEACVDESTRAQQQDTDNIVFVSCGGFF